MLEPGSWLWRWLADQPPFIEVAIGMGFILVLAPAVLAAVALLLARLEGLVEGVVVARLVQRIPAPATHLQRLALRPGQSDDANRSAVWAFVDMKILQR